MSGVTTSSKNVLTSANPFATSTFIAFAPFLLPFLSVTFVNLCVVLIPVYVNSCPFASVPSFSVA